jgi:hypothetical protein
LKIGSSLNIQFTYVPYLSYTHSLKVILCNILSTFVLWLWPITWAQMWNFYLWYHVSTRKVSDLGTVRILNLQIKNVLFYRVLILVFRTWLTLFPFLSFSIPSPIIGDLMEIPFISSNYYSCKFRYAWKSTVYKEELFLTTCKWIIIHL